MVVLTLNVPPTAVKSPPAYRLVPEIVNALTGFDEPLMFGCHEVRMPPAALRLVGSR